MSEDCFVPKAERPRNLLWDALEEHFGPALTKTEQSRRGAAVKELKEAEITPDQVRIAIEFCRRNFTSFSEMAICSWIGRAVHEATQEQGSNVRSIFEKLRQVQ